MSILSVCCMTFKQNSSVSFLPLSSQWMLSKWVPWDLRGRMRWACGAWSPRTARRAWTRRAWRLARARRSPAALLAPRGRTASAQAAGTTGRRWSRRPRPQKTPPPHLPLTGRETRSRWGCTVSSKLKYTKTVKLLLFFVIFCVCFWRMNAKKVAKLCEMWSIYCKSVLRRTPLYV